MFPGPVRGALLAGLRQMRFPAQIAEASASRTGVVVPQEDKQEVDHPIWHFSKKFSALPAVYSSIQKNTFEVYSTLVLVPYV